MGESRIIFSEENSSKMAKREAETEEIIPEQNNNSDNLSVHGPNKKTGRCILKENLEGLALSEDSPLGKTVLEMAQHFVHYLEELFIHKGEVKELEGLIEQYNIIMSYKKNKLREFIRIMLNLLEKPAIIRKTCKKSLEILQLSVIILKRVQHYQYLNKDLQHRSNKYLTQKLNVVNEVLATKESSEYYQRIHLNSPYLFQHKSQV